MWNCAHWYLNIRVHWCPHRGQDKSGLLVSHIYKFSHFSFFSFFSYSFSLRSFVLLCHSIPTPIHINIEIAHKTRSTTTGFTWTNDTSYGRPRRNSDDSNSKRFCLWNNTAAIEHSFNNMFCSQETAAKITSARQRKWGFRIWFKRRKQQHAKANSPIRG